MTNEEKIKEIEEAYGIHMSVERAIDILTIARVQYSSFGSLPEAIDVLINAYREQKKVAVNGQDIVKPYLDKLELQIARKYGATATGDVANACKDIVEMIDNLLPEQGGTE